MAYIQFHSSKLLHLLSPSFAVQKVGPLTLLRMFGSKVGFFSLCGRGLELWKEIREIYRDRRVGKIIYFSQTFNFQSRLTTPIKCQEQMIPTSYIHFSLPLPCPITLPHGCVFIISFEGSLSPISWRRDRKVIRDSLHCWVN
jgi:hypothetical protein